MQDLRNQADPSAQQTIGSTYDRRPTALDTLRAVTAAGLLTTTLFVAGVTLVTMPDPLIARAPLAYAGSSVELA